MKTYGVIKKTFYKNNFGEDIAIAIDYADIAVFNTVEKAVAYVTDETEKYKEIEGEDTFTIQDLRGTDVGIKYEVYQTTFNRNNVRRGYVIFEKEAR